jgi:hypothetical protein
MWIAITVIGLIALATVVSFLAALSRSDASLYTILTFVYSLSILVLVLLGTVFGVALVLLAVDAGRNLREVRRNTTRR